MRPSNTYPSPCAAVRYRGITLVVCLVILSIMGFLGLNAMQSSGIQTAIARHHELRQRVFLAALSELNAQVASLEAAQPQQLPVQIYARGENSGRADDALTQTDDSQVSLEVRITSAENSPPWSGTEVGTFRSLQFEIISTARMHNRSNRSVQVQGISVLIPSTN